MQIGYDAPHNEDCELRDNVIVNGGLSVKQYKRVVNENNLVLPENAPRPDGGPLVVLRPNKYDPDRANLAVFNWGKKESVEADLSPFLREDDRYRLMDPRDFFGEPAGTGQFDGKPARIKAGVEFAAYVVIREGS